MLLARLGRGSPDTSETVSATGVPLGRIDPRTWTRDPAASGTRAQRRFKPTADQESQRGLDALAARLSGINRAAD